MFKSSQWTQCTHFINIRWLIRVWLLPQSTIKWKKINPFKIKYSMSFKRKIWFSNKKFLLKTMKKVFVPIVYRWNTKWLKFRCFCLKSKRSSLKSSFFWLISTKLSLSNFIKKIKSYKNAKVFATSCNNKFNLWKVLRICQNFHSILLSNLFTPLVYHLNHRKKAWTAKKARKLHKIESSETR